MNIWDSVHRGLDRASKEAGRIARAQRLRAQIDKVSRQINTQESALLHQVMDLFLSGRLTQAELLPLCHELADLRQQLGQAQSELQMLQSQGPLPTQAQGGQAAIQGPQAQDLNAQQTLAAPLTMSGDAPSSYIVPPGSPYQPFDATIPAVPPPPPPPGMDLQTLHSQETHMNTLPQPQPQGAEGLTISARETILMPGGSADQLDTGSQKRDAGVPQGEAVSQHCPQCKAEILPGHYFCQRCGSALLPVEHQYQPTVRAGEVGAAYHLNQETILPPTTGGREPSHTDSLTSGAQDGATVYSAPPLPPDTPPATDGGH